MVELLPLRRRPVDNRGRWVGPLCLMRREARHTLPTLGVFVVCQWQTDVLLQ